jgi:hypothetical protein
VHLRIRSTNSVVVVPPSEIRHMPSPVTATATADGDSRTPDTPPISVPHCPGGAASTTAIVYAPLHLCEAYADRGLCPAGVACPDVHAVVTATTPRYYPHVRAYEGNENTLRLGPAGEWHAIAAGNARVATMRIEASECLLTNARERLRLQPAALPAGLCAHFVTKSVCNFGADCRFVHPLSHPTRLQDGAHERSAQVRTTMEAPTVTHAGRTGAHPPSWHHPRRHLAWHNPYGAVPGWQRLAEPVTAKPTM